MIHFLRRIPIEWRKHKYGGLRYVFMLAWRKSAPAEQFYQDVSAREFAELTGKYTKEDLERLLKDDLPCPHARPAGQLCPHCSGVNKE